MKKKQKIEAVVTAAGAGLLLVLAVSRTTSLGQTYCVVSVNGTEIGAVAQGEDTKGLELEARRKVMQDCEGYAYVNADVTVEYSNQRFRRISTAEELLPKLTAAIANTRLSGKTQAYTITAGSYSANFASREAAYDFLEQVKNHTEGGSEFKISLDASSGQRDVRKAEIVKTDAGELEEEEENTGTEMASAGIISALAKMYASPQNEKSENYQNQTGILAMDFADTVYGYENLVDADTIADPAEQTEEVTKEKETNTIYVVEAGDCLSIIAEKFETTVDSIVALNQLSGEEAVVYMDQELIVAVPRPDISLRVSEGIVYEESYAAEPQIIPNDAWYTTTEVVHQEGSDGLREINALVTYENGLEVERKTLHTLVLAEAVPSVVEQGTQIPPTYIKPLSGGRYTSGFGRRWGRMHKGVDWATPIGTTVYASSKGTVSVAGAVRGYGYAVYINHPDGRQTRYGHLSKVLVSPGQTVEQGQIIALSGNTGRSTGPHVHFEILIDGAQVNPLNYMN